MRREDRVADCAGVSGQEGLRGNGFTGLAWVAQLVERVLGKDEVTGSIPVPGSRKQAVPPIGSNERRLDEEAG